MCKDGYCKNDIIYGKFEDIKMKLKLWLSNDFNCRGAGVDYPEIVNLIIGLSEFEAIEMIKKILEWWRVEEEKKFLQLGRNFLLLSYYWECWDVFFLSLEYFTISDFFGINASSSGKDISLWRAI